LDTFINSNTAYIHPKAEIYHSTVGERGVFAIADYYIEDDIEICPTIKTKTEFINDRINDYTFAFDEQYSLVAFGYCSMYNHSDEPNAKWIIMNENQMKIKAIKNIKKGDEIFVSYGNDYWTQRNNLLKKN
jgi:hypothetical protein